MRIIGLTGGMASGKSEATKYLRSRGLAVLDADEISRRLTAKGEKGALALYDELGEEYFKDGEPDRGKIAGWAFSCEQNTKRLNEIIHPLVIDRLKSELKRLEEEGAQIAIMDCPLLFESGLDKLCYEIWLITADIETRIKRAEKRSGLTREQAEKRIARQMRDEERAKHSNEIIDNNGTPAELEEKLKKLTDRLLAKD